GAERPQRARGLLTQQRASCQRVRRPRSLLDLPHPHHRRLQRATPTLATRGLRARPRRRYRSVDTPCLPVAPDQRPVVLPVVPAAHGVGWLPWLEPDADRPGALSRQHVRGYARLEQACGETAPVLP